MRKGKCVGDTVRWTDWQDIGEECTQCQWRWGDRWFGSDHGKHELLGRMHVDVCEGKAMEDSIRGVHQVWVIVICTNIHSYRIQRRRVEKSFVQQIAGGDGLLEFQTATTSSY